MIYVTANLFGNHEKFQKLLETIHFKDSDYLYILGNLVDYGSDSMALLEDVSMRLNVFTILGEHDYRASKMLFGFDKMLKSGDTPSSSFISEMQKWAKDGGQPTLDGYRTLDEDMKEGALDYLTDMSFYEEVDVKGKTFVLLHAGVRKYRAGDCLDDYDPEDFITEPLDLSRKLFDDKTVVCARVSDESESGDSTVFYGNGAICLIGDGKDDDKIACLCLDNGKEYYI